MEWFRLSGTVKMSSPSFSWLLIISCTPPTWLWVEETLLLCWWSEFSGNLNANKGMTINIYIFYKKYFSHIFGKKCWYGGNVTKNIKNTAVLSSALLGSPTLVLGIFAALLLYFLCSTCKSLCNQKILFDKRQQNSLKKKFVFLFIFWLFV